MPTNKHRIYPLDGISQARIKSSVQITCLNDIIVELVKNALDAQADSISVVLNYCHGFCMIQDDGHGVPAQEFADNGKLAQSYCTSKSDGHDNIYGRYGRYLAALSRVALLSISSRSDDRYVHTLWLDDTGRIGQATDDGDDWQTCQGTRVKVYNLFAKFPVRSKHLADCFTSTLEIEKQFEQLKHAITALILALPRPFDIDIQHSSSNCKYRHKSSTGIKAALQSHGVHRNSEFAHFALQQAGYADRSQYASWRNPTINSNGISIRAALSLDPVPHKLVQFISVNHEPLTKQTHLPLFDTVNAAFGASTFGTLDADVDLPPPKPQDEVEHRIGNRKSRPDQRKGVDKWPMFVIWVDTRLATSQTFLHSTGSDRSIEKLTARISTLLDLMLTEFLTSHDFLHPSKRQEQRRHPAVSTSNGLALHVSSPRHSFESWSRIKSSCGLVPDNVLSGLPFRKRKHSKVHTIPDATTILEASLSAAAEFVAENRLVASTEQEHVVECTDPKTGRLLRINSRTGMALPESSHSSEWPQSSTSCHKKQRRLSMSQVALNVKQYAQSCYSVNNQPIRSIALFDYGGQSIEEQAQTRRKKVGHFWHSVGECRNANPQLGMPQILKRALKDAIVLGQLDRKFILTLVPCGDSSPNHNSAVEYQLVLIDQHAADERSKAEQLMCTFHYGTITLNIPMIFEVSATEASLLEAAKSYFEQWHIFYSVGSLVQLPAQSGVAGVTKQQVRVTALPSTIVERCRLKPQIIIDLLREEIWSDSRPPRTSRIHRDECPKTVVAIESSCCYGRSSHSHNALSTSYLPPRLLDLLNSRACRSAIMFNDELTISQCTNLVASLSECTLPFQCAHGRPSMVVLADLSHMGKLEPLAPDTMGMNMLAWSSRAGLSLRSERMGLNNIDELRTFGHAYHDWIAKDGSQLKSVATLSEAQESII